MQNKFYLLLNYLGCGHSQRYGLMILFFYIVISLSFICSCSEEDESKDQITTPLEIKEDILDTDTTPTSPILIELNEPKDKKSQTFTMEKIQGDSALLALMPKQRVIPEDFKIGPLQDSLEGQWDTISAVWVLRTFFDSFKKKDIKRELLEKEQADEIVRSLSYSIEQNYIPNRYRISQADFSNDNEIRVNMRFFNKKGVTEGEIYLSKNDKNWVISDIQIGFHLLDQEYQKDEELFMPASFRWMLYE